jgi:tetratricopeptide (TPR) repeat protein
MRLAVVIATESPPAHDGPARALADRVLRDGWNVFRLSPGPRLASDYARALADATSEDAVLVSVGGSSRLDGDGGIQLRAGGPEFALAALVATVRERKVKNALFVVDLTYEGDDDGFVAADHVAAVARTTGARDGGYGLLVGACAARRAASKGAPWALSRLFVDALSDPRARDGEGRVTMSRVYERVRATPDFGVRVPSYTHVRGAVDFVLLDPSASNPPPSLGSGPVSAPVSAPSSSASFDSLLSAAEAAHKRGSWDDALAGYKKALMLAPAEGPVRAEVYCRIAEAKEAQGKRGEAELNLEKALATHPTHRRAFESLLAFATAAGDWPRVLTFRKKMRSALNDPGQLLSIAELLEDRLRDVRGALEVLEEARLLTSDDVKVLRKLRAIYEKLGRWGKVAEVVGDLCRESNDPKERGELRFVQADILLGRQRDEVRGLALLEGALEEDPAHDKALHALIAVRTRREEWSALERTYARLIDGHAERGDAERAWDVCRRLGLLRRDVLRDPAGALDAFEGAVRCKADDVESRAALADLLMTKGDLDRAHDELVKMAAQAPTRVATFRKLFELHTRRGDLDRAWCTATALEELKSADMDHQMLIEQFRPEASTVARVEVALDDESWDKLLRASGADPTVAAVLRAVARPAAATKIDVLRAQKKLLSLSPERKQSQTSTVSIIRTFVWASKILDTPLPDLYVYDDVPGGLGAVQGVSMATAIGPAVLSGLPVRELAFLVARHLSYYRPEHYVLIFFPSLAELSSLFLAAVSLALPATRGGLSAQAAKLRKELEPHVGQAEKQELALAVTRFNDGGGRVDLASWIRGVELTATRAGLLLAGDLAIAMRVVGRESRGIADVSRDDRRADLLAWTASTGYAKLRKWLGIDARKGSRPPPSLSQPPPSSPATR